MRTAYLLATCVVLLAVSGPIGLAGETQSPSDLSKIAGWKGAAPNAGDAFHFIVMSDRTGGHLPGAWALAVEQVNRVKPDLVMSVGDLIEGYTDDEAKLLAQWKEFDALTQKLDAPFFYCPGNHDVTDDKPREVYTRLHGVNGRTYYSFDYRGCHFIVLDSTAFEVQLTDLVNAQLEWLAKDLAAAKDARHVFMFFHHPIYDNEVWPRIRKLLDAGKTTIFTGHWHGLSYDLEDGVPFYVLSATAAQSAAGENENRSEGSFHSYASVLVSDGKPAVSIVPVGEVLPHDMIDRGVRKVHTAVRGGLLVTSVTAGGGPSVLRISNPTGSQVRYELSWSGDAKWFSDGTPKAESVVLPAGQSTERQYRIAAAPAHTEPPALTIEYQTAYKEKTLQGKRTLPLPVVATLDALRVSGIHVDGKLDDWTTVPGCVAATRGRVKDNPEAWLGPQDCSMVTRVGYDDAWVYLAIDVTDEALVTQARQVWLKDGVEIFWDPRPAAARDGRFAGPCRQLIVSVPADAGEPPIEVSPGGGKLADKLKVGWASRAGGYVLELAIPAGIVAEGFQPAPGVQLAIEVLVDDKDDPAPQAPTSGMVLSGDSDASKNTGSYGLVTFR
ncbi:MAG TPA: sugar-binding protein [Phycisphaerae bacterium]|nr:sugar-binding protein [Phycisphaerae bacterium]